MKLPTWEELNAQQKSVLETPFDESLFVVGPPGSGKTVLAVERARGVLESESDRTVAVVTYNRMLRRLVDLLGGPDPETMHVFVGRDYHRKTNEFVPKVSGTTHVYDWDAMLSTLDEREEPDEYSLSHLVIDEGQDLAAQFFTYASRHVAPALTIFADDDQALGQRHTSVEQILAAATLPKPIVLSENHRNSPEVAAVAEHFHAGRLAAAVVKRTGTGDRPRLIQGEGVRATCQRIANWVQNRGGSVGVVVNNNPTGTEVQKQLWKLLTDTRVDAYTFENSNDGAIELLEPGVTILNHKSVKGQEFDAVFVLELEKLLPCTTKTCKRLMYMLCARARDHLFLVSATKLSSEQLASLPPEQLLERG